MRPTEAREPARPEFVETRIAELQRQLALEQNEDRVTVATQLTEEEEGERQW